MDCIKVLIYYKHRCLNYLLVVLLHHKLVILELKVHKYLRNKIH